MSQQFPLITGWELLPCFNAARGQSPRLQSRVNNPPSRKEHQHAAVLNRNNLRELLRMSKIHYRKEAVEALAEDRQTDQPLRIVPPFAWVVLFTVLLLLLVAVVWSVVGVIPSQAQGDGILIAEKGSVYVAEAPQGSAHVMKLNVVPGDRVQKGEVIAELVHPDLEKQITVSKKYLDQIMGKYNSEVEVSKQQIADRAAELSKRRVLLEQIVKNENENLTEIEHFLDIKKKAFKQGLETRQNVMSTLQNYYNSKREISRVQDLIYQNNMKDADFKHSWQRRLYDLDTKLKDAETALEKLKAKLVSSNEIISPITGIVTHVQTFVGNVVEGGDSIVSVTSTGEGMDALVFVAPVVGKRIKPGMAAQISPATVKREEFGSIRGIVNSVSAFPAGRQSLMALLQNETLVKTFSNEFSPIIVRVRLTSDSATASGFDWTSSKGPEQTITPGTIASASITLRERRPIVMVIPAFKKLMGS